MQELTTHTRLATGASKDALNLDYMVHIRNAIVKPLIDNGTDGIEAAIAVMGKYHLMRSVFYVQYIYLTLFLSVQHMISLDECMIHDTLFPF